ncbi:MAG: hypothetical protein BGO88_12020 [Flavobacterium sp. 38-13]|uniref:hypothetical protein n=1 Tax=Flavobacterium sp. 38-13 TaxID=1896168 RepID=UPI0009672F3D|nr:hypothetical protein [Flavobacterium sp. 38-13]OJX54368.1 MAG: hypothetical protein BGO88_12020 [Flavobacterium sp. 38-13]
MELKYQKEISTIENCPIENLSGEKILFRCVEESMTENSFLPNAVLLKPKFEKECLAWGLSLFSSYDSAKQVLQNLSKSKKVNYSKIARTNLTDNDGIKHCSKNKSHYTFYPQKNLDLLTKFVIVEENGK